MRLWLASFHLLYISSCAQVKASDEVFHVMTLGSSGLLIFWDPSMIKGVDATEMVTFGYRMFNESESNVIAELADCALGQHKIRSALKEDSVYEIYIDIDNNIHSKITCKTGLKTNSLPVKPYFEWQVSDPDTYGPFIRITWIPCGKNRDCHGNEAGSHFAIRYKALDLRETITVVERGKDTHDILITSPEKIYEIVVVSINGDFEAESDTQEIFLTPISGPVHSLRVMILTNTSIYISWEKPRLSTHKVNNYFCSSFSSGDSEDRMNSVYLRQRVNYLIPNLTYTFLIIPCGRLWCGLKFDFAIQSIQPNLMLAKPDFTFERLSADRKKCKYRVFWLPCGKNLDCNNLSPGSGFELKIKNETKVLSKYEEKEADFTEIEIERGKAYTVIVKSVDEFDQSSESVTKTLICKKHRRNRHKNKD